MQGSGAAQERNGGKDIYLYDDEVQVNILIWGHALMIIFYLTTLSMCQKPL